MTVICSFTIPGYCQPKQRTFGRWFITPPETRAYENTIRKIAHHSMAGRLPIIGFLSLEIDIICEVPKSWTKKKKILACEDKIFPTHCDIDNQIKIISDGMNRIVYEDDRFISEIRARRYFGIEDKAIVTIKEMVVA